jgi:hypothetical protein
MQVCCNLRGTSGSGKSTIVRELMARYATKEAQFRLGRKQPLSYKLYREEGAPLFVVGHYEQPTGGADSISDGMNFIYEMIHKALEEQFDCVWEGLVVASDVTRCANLKDTTKLLVIELSTPIDVCLEGIRSRREIKAAARSAAKGKDLPAKPVDPTNTIAKMFQLRPQRIRFKNAGVDFRYLNREEAMRATLEHFGWTL